MGFGPRKEKTLREIVDDKYEGFVDEVDRLSIPELEMRISRYQKSLQESEEHRENNEVLNKLKDEVSTLSGPYNDVKKAVKLKTKYIIELIKEKGGA